MSIFFFSALKFLSLTQILFKPGSDRRGLALQGKQGKQGKQGGKELMLSLSQGCKPMSKDMEKID